MNKLTKTIAALSVSAAALSGVAAPASASEASAIGAGIWDSVVRYGPAEAIYNLAPDSRLFYRVTHPTDSGVINTFITLGAIGAISAVVIGKVAQQTGHATGKPLPF